MKLPTLDTADVSGKRVFFRADLDVPLAVSSQQLGVSIEDDTRLKAGLPTIEYLLKQGATVIVTGKLGRPKGIDKSLSLEPVAEWLAQQFKVQREKCKVEGFEGWQVGNNLWLLENLRFYEGEEANDLEFAKKLASLAEIYVNDSFAVSHREHASIVSVPKFLPHYVGFHLQKEVEVLTGVLNNPKRPLVVIIGGVKIETKLPLIKKMRSFADFVLVGGKLPVEFRIQNSEFRIQDDKRLLIADLTPDGTDITEESVKRFIEIIEKAAMIVWNGPLGKLEVRSEPSEASLARGGKLEVNDTERGTREVAIAITQSSAYKIVGGGDTVDYLKRLGLIDKFDFVSTGGGAMLTFLSGEKLPGLEALF